MVPLLRGSGWTGRIVEQYPDHRRQDRSRSSSRTASPGPSPRPASARRLRTRARAGLPVAVVEAKRRVQTIPGKGLQQAKNYAQLLDLPFAYSTNGKGIVEDDRDTGRERNLDGFPTRTSSGRATARGRASLMTRCDACSAVQPSPANSDGTSRSPATTSGAITALHAILGATTTSAPAHDGDRHRQDVRRDADRLEAVEERLAPGRNPRILYLADRNILIDQPDRLLSSGRSARPDLEDPGRGEAGREIYFALYQALADSGEDDGIFRDYRARLLRPGRRRRVPPGQRPRRVLLAAHPRSLLARRRSSG